MRVLTTMMFFDEKSINTSPEFDRPRGRGEGVEPGVGVAWFGGSTADMLSLENLKDFRRLPGSPDYTFTEDTLRNYLDLFLMGAREYEFDRPDRSLKNAETVDYLLKEPFVIERSPPVHIALKGLVNSTNLPVWIGTYMGWSIVPDHSVLLFVTVPGGIIVVSSAAGLASALSAGLSKSVKRLFK